MFGIKRLKKNNDILFKRNTELNNFCNDLQKSNKKLKEINKTISDELMITNAVLDEKKKEVKKLKTLLTKNKIKYRKEN